jgi:hypothetical protein
MIQTLLTPKISVLSSILRRRSNTKNVEINVDLKQGKLPGVALLGQVPRALGTA